jgi:Uncharacterized protein conserved in bacteria
MRGSWAALALLVMAGATDAHAQSYPSRPITLVVPFPRADRPTPPPGSWPSGCGLARAIDRDRKCRRRRRQHRRRPRRARAPDGYTFDIGQWDTHVGSIIYKLDYDLEKDFEPIALISNNPQLMVAKNDLPATRSPNS